jgi:hypothetical protein
MRFRELPTLKSQFLRHVMIAVGCLFLAATPALAQNLDEEMLADIEEEMQTVRDLELLDPINVSTMTLEEYQEQTREELEGYPAESWQRDQAALVAMGLLDENADIQDIYTQAYGGSFVGYYDPATDEMVLIAFSDGEDLSPLGQVTYAHETVHAIQDQHFDLEDMLSSSLEGNGDGALAVRSLIEGDAMTAEAQYLLDNRELALAYLEEVMGIQENDPDLAGDMPGFLIAQIGFPYEHGVEFVQYLYDEGGWELVNEAYTTPPTSTEQILHPEKYLEGEEPIEVEIEDLSAVLGEDWEEIQADTWGEFGVDTLLVESDLSTRQVRRASEGWGGDAYSIMLNEDNELAVVWQSEWDSERDAREFARTYAEREIERIDGDADNSDDMTVIVGDDSVIIIVQDGESVTYVQAPTQEEAELLLDEL